MKTLEKILVTGMILGWFTAMGGAFSKKPEIVYGGMGTSVGLYYVLYKTSK